MKKVIIALAFPVAFAVVANATASDSTTAVLPAAPVVSRFPDALPQASPAQTKTSDEKPAPAPPATDDDAFETPLPYPSARRALSEIGKSYKRYAASLGCGRFAWGTISTDGSQFTLKYLPPGETLAAWTKMALVTVYSIPGDKGRKDAQAIARIISETEGEYIKLAHVTNDENYPTPNGEIRMFLQYTMGQIDAAAAFIRTGPSSASMIQLQQRGGKLSPDDILKVNKLSNPDAGRTAPAPAKK
jgi:hypothetical protein